MKYLNADDINGLNGRRIIVLQEKGKFGRNLNAAISAAAEYRNPNGIVEIVRAEKEIDDDWIWRSAFTQAAERPDTFIALEDGSVLRKRLLDLKDEIEAIARIGNGLSFAHHSSELFLRILGGEYFVLADKPLEKLIGILDAQDELSGMGLDVVSQETQQAEAQRLVQTLLKNGITTTEISERLGLNRSTIYRWKEKLGLI